MQGTEEVVHLKHTIVHTLANWDEVYVILC